MPPHPHQHSSRVSLLLPPSCAWGMLSRWGLTCIPPLAKDAGHLFVGSEQIRFPSQIFLKCYVFFQTPHVPLQVQHPPSPRC